MKKKLAEKDLVKKAKARDAQSKHAFDQLVLRHQAKLLQVIKSLIKDHAEALDVLQESFLKAYKALPDFREESAFYSWIYRIAVNTAKNHIQKLGRSPIQSSLDIEDETLPPSQEGLYGKLTTQEDILAALNQLPKKLSEALILREIKGLSYQEISEQLTIPIGTVRSRIARGRAALKKL